MLPFLSKNQTLLLGLFYARPEKTCYLQEIGRLVGKQPGVFQRTLNALVEKGYLKSEYRANLRYFQANTLNPLYPEIRKIIAKLTGVETLLKNLIESIPAIKSAFIFGSFAKGVERESSDVDLLVVGNPNAERVLLKEIPGIEKKIQREINFKIYSVNEFNAKSNKDPFLKEILKGKMIVLKGNPNEP